MAYQTFFEIGGHVIESYTESQGHPARPMISNPLLEKGKEMGVPKPLLKQAQKEIKTASGIDIGKVSRSAGRAKRAGWAIRTAAALALVDGPIPVGDAAAAVFLVAYAGYESALAVQDLKEGVGY